MCSDACSVCIVGFPPQRQICAESAVKTARSAPLTASAQNANQAQGETNSLMVLELTAHCSSATANTDSSLTCTHTSASQKNPTSLYSKEYLSFSIDTQPTEGISCPFLPLLHRKRTKHVCYIHHIVPS